MFIVTEAQSGEVSGKAPEKLRGQIMQNIPYHLNHLCFKSSGEPLKG